MVPELSWVRLMARRIREVSGSAGCVRDGIQMLSLSRWPTSTRGSFGPSWRGTNNTIRRATLQSAAHMALPHGGHGGHEASVTCPPPLWIEGGECHGELPSYRVVLGESPGPICRHTSKAVRVKPQFHNISDERPLDPVTLGSPRSGKRHFRRPSKETIVKNKVTTSTLLMLLAGAASAASDQNHERPDLQATPVTSVQKKEVKAGSIYSTKELARAGLI
jgi:hypothetical protein